MTMKTKSGGEQNMQPELWFSLRQNANPALRCFNHKAVVPHVMHNVKRSYVPAKAVSERLRECAVKHDEIVRGAKLDKLGQQSSCHPKLWSGSRGRPWTHRCVYFVQLFDVMLRWPLMWRSIFRCCSHDCCLFWPDLIALELTAPVPAQSASKQATSSLFEMFRIGTHETRDQHKDVRHRLGNPVGGSPRAYNKQACTLWWRNVEDL